MCDYCDCRCIPKIADLGAEHQRMEERADDHIAFEDHDRFPAAGQVLKGAQWEAMV